MRLLDALTLLSMSEHEPNTRVSVLFDGATYYFGAHAGCIKEERERCAEEGCSDRIVNVYLIEEGDQTTSAVEDCYYCCRENYGPRGFMASALKPF